jgi:hypothetical protein
MRDGETLLPALTRIPRIRIRTRPIAKSRTFVYLKVQFSVKSSHMRTWIIELVLLRVRWLRPLGGDAHVQRMRTVSQSDAQMRAGETLLTLRRKTRN